MPVDETKIPPPVSPLTVQMNLAILRFFSKVFSAKWFPTMERVVTSDYRTVEHNKSVGGEENSAHVHGLAEDFQLKYKAGGQVVPEAQAKIVYDTIIAPNWPGFTEWEGSSKGEGYHIHWNLSREITSYIGPVGLAALGVVGVAVINHWSNKNG